MSKRTGIVVTGGSSGIGLGIVEALLAANYHVINLSRRDAPLEHQHLVNLNVDLTDRAALDEVCSKLSEYEVLSFVHNAGMILPHLIDEVEMQELDALNQLHLGAAIQIGQAIIPTMRRAGFGRIVIISSRASVGMATRTSYSATKAGQIALARTWALELAAHGITVNTVAPGPIEATEMFHELVEPESEVSRQLAAAIPVKRLGRPKDVVRAVMFFLDDENSFVTGQNLFVCGGTSIGSI